MIMRDCSRFTYNLDELQVFVNLTTVVAPMMEPTAANSKGELLPSTTPTTFSTGSAGEKRPKNWKYLACSVLGSLTLLHVLNRVDFLPLDLSSPRFDTAGALCPQEGAIYPVKEQAVFQKLAEIYGTEEFKTRAIDWVSSFARCKCISFDGLLYFYDGQIGGAVRVEYVHLRLW